MDGLPSSTLESTGNSLYVDANSPVIAVGGVVLTPTSTTVKVDDVVTITVTEDSNEAGLTPSNATFNSQSVVLTDVGGGDYVGVYTVIEGHFNCCVKLSWFIWLN